MEPLSLTPVQVDSWLSEDDERSLANDVLDGLTKPFKELAPKHFYDARGSELFEQITELPEYYPTRTELAILRDNAAGRSSRSPAPASWWSSGPAPPTRPACCSTRCATRARCGATSRSTCPRAWWRTPRGTLIEDYEDLQVYGVVGDFERHLEHVPAPRRAAATARGAAGRHDRQLPARARGATCWPRSPRCWAPTTGCCWAPTWSRTRA